MKTHKNLFEKITSFENLLNAAKKAQRGKRFKRATALFNFNLERELLKLQRELLSESYCHGRYHDFFICDPKRRLISAAPYRDRVVHHALCNIIEPVFDRSFIDDSYACRIGKGTHAAVDRYSAFAKKNQYVLQCDIRKYFSSIDHEILMQQVLRKIACKKTLRLIQEILLSRKDISHIVYFPGDDLFTPYKRPKGIPIGNLTSQFFANVYLNSMDHFIKERLRCRYYIRYVDDFVVLENDKPKLQNIKKAIVDYLSHLRLKMHPKKCRIYQAKEGIRFLGYRIFPNHRLLNKDNALRMRRRLKEMQKGYQNGSLNLTDIKKRINSWIGHAGHANTWQLRRRILSAAVFKKGCCQKQKKHLVQQ